MKKTLDFEHMKKQLPKRGFRLCQDMVFRKHYRYQQDSFEAKGERKEIVFEVWADNTFYIIRDKLGFDKEIEVELAKDITALLKMGAILL